MRRMLCLALAGGIAFSSTGCYGPFRLTKRLHDWNGQVSENKWVNEGVFLAFVILPVYAGASLADAVVFNSIEFWGGDNPVAKAPRAIEAGDAKAVVKADPAARRVRIDAFRDERPAGTIVLEPGPDGLTTARDAEGKLLGTAETVDGKVVVRAPSGEELGRFDPATLERSGS